MLFSYPQLFKARLIGQLRTKTRVADKLEFIKDDDRGSTETPTTYSCAVNYTYFPSAVNSVKIKQETERRVSY